MEYTLLLVWLGLIYTRRCDGASLLQGDVQHQVLAPSTPSGGPSPAPLSVGNPASGLFNEQVQEPYVTVTPKPYFPLRGNIRKSFSLETTTPPTTPHFEALTARNYSGQPRPRAYYINNERVEDDGSRDIVSEYNSLKRGKNVNFGYLSSSPAYESHSYEEMLADRSAVQPSGPSVVVQQKPLWWSTEPNIIREQDLDGTLGSLSYATPTPSSLRPPSYRGNVRYTVPTTSEPFYEPTRSGKDLPTRAYGESNIDHRRAFIAPTTYRPLYSPTPNPNEYSFSFRNQNSSREEIGNSKGQFRGSIKFVDASGRDKQIHYEANPQTGLVTSEAPFVSVPGRSGQRYVPPLSTPRPFVPSGGAYSYSYVGNEALPSSTDAYENDLRYGKSYPTTENYPSPIPNQQPTMRSLPTPDGSYVFSFDAGDQERHETRDSSGNVRGMYSYESPDGERKMVHYAANARDGFVAQGRHLPVQESRVSAGDERYQDAGQEPGGGTYFFSYDAGDHAREEERDSSGNVRGSFSFLTGDGLKKTVHYHANPEDGFHIKSTQVDRVPQYK